MSENASPRAPMTRRQFVRQGALAFAGILLASCADEEQEPAQTSTPDATQAVAAATPGIAAPATSAAEPTAQAPTLAPTPQCDDDETPAQTEGPFYTPDTPQRRSFLEDGAGGAVFVLTGRVLSTACEPLANAVVDFWHADENGQYDNAGFRYRGHQFTDDQGRYRLETILPGLYPGRTRHIHVKVQGQSTPLLTTQLYFPGEPGNATDGLFDDALLVTLPEAGNIEAATFDFVLETTA